MLVGASLSSWRQRGRGSKREAEETGEVFSEGPRGKHKKEGGRGRGCNLPTHPTGPGRGPDPGPEAMSL